MVTSPVMMMVLSDLGLFISFSSILFKSKFCAQSNWTLRSSLQVTESGTDEDPEGPLVFLEHRFDSPSCLA